VTVLGAVGQTGQDEEGGIGIVTGIEISVRRYYAARTTWHVVIITQG
jgi:hypothetical protein